MLKRTAKPENSQPAAKRKLTRAERKQIEAIIRQAKGDGIQNMHVFALHLAVTDKIAGCRQRREAAADDIGRFLIDALRLFGPCKCFIVTARIIHDSYLHKKSGNIALCFPFDGMSILRIQKMHNNQKTPCDKVLITGR